MTDMAVQAGRISNSGVPRCNTEAELFLSLQCSSSKQKLIYSIKETYEGIESESRNSPITAALVLGKSHYSTENSSILRKITLKKKKNQNNACYYKLNFNRAFIFFKETRPSFCPFITAATPIISTVIKGISETQTALTQEII